MLKKALAELARRQAQALAMGGAEKIARQHSLGRMTVRERIDYLLDRGSFYETGLLAQSQLPEARDKTPADGKVCGYGTIEGQTVGISADDATVMAGAGGRIGYEKAFKIHHYAQEKGFPAIHLGDGGGARIPDIMGAVGMMNFTYDISHAPRNRQIPKITVIMGECFGGPTWEAASSDLIVQVKGSTMAVAGPVVLAAATTEQAEKEHLGGWELHAHHTGLADHTADTEKAALRWVKKVLTYLPPNYQQLPPTQSPPESTPFRQTSLYELIPQNDKYGYDMHPVLETIFDKGSLLELKPFFDGSLITSLARLNGQVVGVLANNPKVNAGAMGPGACEKATQFICFCDSFHIPLVFLHDTPGFFVGQAAERRKMPVQIMNFIQALQQSTVPKLSLILRKSYGMAHCNMLGANMGADFLLAYPQAEVSFMAPEVAANIVLGRKLAQVANPEEIKKAFMAEMQQINAPWEAAAANLIDKIIDPADTRQELIRCLSLAKSRYPQGGMSQRRMTNWPKMA
ncbi:acyl-CoA carboxylase subunit beta [Eisenibacter elegans]|uniref:acyl-CoA carboxylase subunit beta n=1 Tax=Eisenibacter elegans TaxID=997 RepID=UPI0004045180|nr:carboxyl transferase domain-containing protein [Eisenibacter elegans]